MLVMENVVRKNDEGQQFESKMVFCNGRLTSDIATKVVNVKDEQKVVTDGRTAVAVDYFEKGEKKTVFLNLEAWEKRAETLAKYGTKGRRISITGKYKESSWKNEQQEEKISKILVVEQFEFLDFVEQGDDKGQKEESNNLDGFTPADDDDIPF